MESGTSITFDFNHQKKFHKIASTWVCSTISWPPKIDTLDLFELILTIGAVIVFTKAEEWQANNLITEN